MTPVCRLSAEEYEQLRDLQVKYRWDWPAVFSGNAAGSIWPFRCLGRTPFDQRIDVRGMSSAIDFVADRNLVEREGGGRFFINDMGAFYKDPLSQLHRLVR